jgi:hypothetical protein
MENPTVYFEKIGPANEKIEPRITQITQIGMEYFRLISV